MKRIARWTAVVLLALFGVAQLVPVERTNPTVDGEITAPAEVHSILQRACYDCHSNETVWPWYSRIAPPSWLIAQDVREGRAALNFSSWNRLSAKEQSEAALATYEEVVEGEMPPSLYLSPHPEARLSQEDRAILQEWARTAGQDEFAAEQVESEDD